MTPSTKQKILQRPEYDQLKTIESIYEWQDERVLITGSNGNIGKRLTERLIAAGVNVLPTTKDDFDITKPIASVLLKYKPTIIINLAGVKNLNESDAIDTFNVNTNGLMNIIQSLDAVKVQARIVQVSSTKACEPETMYGASKLISERIVLNHDGAVARLCNVIETPGNVFDLWRNQDVVKVSMGCSRYYITLDEAVGLIIFTCFKSGRFVINTPDSISMEHLVTIVHPEKSVHYLDRRSGDNLEDKFKSASERIIDVFMNNAILKIESNHD